MSTCDPILFICQLVILCLYILAYNFYTFICQLITSIRFVVIFTDTSLILLFIFISSNHKQNKLHVYYMHKH